MRYFIDTEFIEDGKTIDLISIGIVAQDGREYYAVSNQFNPSKASQWVLDNVLAPMGINKNGWVATPDILSPTQREHWKAQRNRKRIAQDVMDFCAPAFHGVPEFWGYYADYDWVAFCQLFGTMMDLPKGFPMYCRDVKQLCDDLDNPELPKQEHGEHNALEDARWTRAAFDYLVALRGRRGAP